LVDGGGDLSPEQLENIFQGIKPAFGRLTMTFPDVEAYLEKMKSAPYMRPWNAVIETYYRYEIEECPEGVKTNISPVHMAEEAGNMRKVNCREYYPKLDCKTLILRATEGLLSENEILLPTDVIDRMMSGISKALSYDVEGTNHYGIIMQSHEGRNQALLEFLEKD